ncbi:MAG TPA: DinB family protein [Candidatus Methylomirabilis sp.]|nr:DinB family protein [Candidatus Methylomirabilis sp.]
MSERTLIELLYGGGAHANTVGCVEDLPAELAGRLPQHFQHSVWQLVAHLNYWMDYDLRRVGGENPPYPAHAAESWPQNIAPPSEAAWKKEVTRFAEHLATHAKMAEWDSNALSRHVPATHPSHEARSSTVLAILWQSVAHNSYHVGQIAQVRRALGAWPPKQGGDTW